MSDIPPPFHFMRSPENIPPTPTRTTGKLSYIWDDLYLYNIVLPAVLQDKYSCSFMAVARQVEYQIRIAYAMCDLPLPTEPIIEHKAWEKVIRKNAPGQLRWWPIDLITKILCEDVDNPEGERRLGIPYTMSWLPHWVNERHHLSKDERTVKHIKSLLDQRIPVVAVINIFEDRYPSYGQYPYVDKDNLDWSKADKTHAVVLVGVYEAGENDEYGLPPGIYWLYQNSFPKGSYGKDVDGLLGNGINILGPELVIDISYSISYPAPIFMRLPKTDPKVQKLSRYSYNLLKKQRLEREAYLKLRREHTSSR